MNGSVRPNAAGPNAARASGRAHHLRSRDAEHAHPLTVAQPLGGDRLGGLAVHHADQVGHDGHHLAVAAGDEVLVLERDLELVVARRRRRRSGARPLREAFGRAPLDVGDLAREQLAHVRVEGGRQASARCASNGERCSSRAMPDRAAERERHRDRAGHGGALHVGAAHRILGDVADAAEPDRDAAREPLHLPVVVAGVDDDRLAAFAGQRQRRAVHAVDRERLHRQLGERPAHAVGVDHRQPGLGRDDQRDHRVDAAALDRHGGVGGAAEVLLERAQGERRLRAARGSSRSSRSARPSARSGSRTGRRRARRGRVR